MYRRILKLMTGLLEFFKMRSMYFNHNRCAGIALKKLAGKFLSFSSRNPPPHIRSPLGLLNCLLLKTFEGGFYNGGASNMTFV